MSHFRHTSLKTFLFPPTRHFGCVTVTDRDRPNFEFCSCLWTCAIVYSISFTRMNRESLYKISSPQSNRNIKLSYHMCILSRHRVFKSWCQNICVSWACVVGKCPFLRTKCGPGSIVGIATGYGLDAPGIESRLRRDFPHLSRPVLRPTQPPV